MEEEYEPPAAAAAARAEQHRAPPGRHPYVTKDEWQRRADALHVDYRESDTIPTLRRKINAKKEKNKADAKRREEARDRAARAAKGERQRKKLRSYRKDPENYYEDDD
jgi:hypothetical protein